MANKKEYNMKKRALTEHYSNRILAIFTVGVFNFILLFYLYQNACGRMGTFLLEHHYAVYNVLAICSVVVAAALFVCWLLDKRTKPFYKENYFYFWIYFLVAAVVFVLIRPVSNWLGTAKKWWYVYIAVDVLYVVASSIYFSIVSRVKVKKLQK